MINAVEDSKVRKTRKSLIIFNLIILFIVLPEAKLNNIKLLVGDLTVQKPEWIIWLLYGITVYLLIAYLLQFRRWGKEWSNSKLERKFQDKFLEDKLQIILKKKKSSPDEYDMLKSYIKVERKDVLLHTMLALSAPILLTIATIIIGIYKGIFM